MLSEEYCGCTEHHDLVFDGKVSEEQCAVPCSGNGTVSCGGLNHTKTVRIADQGDVYQIGTGEVFAHNSQ